MIAIPYRIEADGKDQPITLHESFRLENVTAELEHLAVEVEELRAANSETIRLVRRIYDRRCY